MQLPIPMPDSIQFHCTQSHILASRRLETWLDSSNHIARTTQETQPLFCWKGLYTAPLHSKSSYSIFVCVFVAAGMGLPSRCLTVNVYPVFTIPAFEHHVTISCHHTDYTASYLRREQYELCSLICVNAFFPPVLKKNWCNLIFLFS
jgi:hypothetical protein